MEEGLKYAQQTVLWTPRPQCTHGPSQTQSEGCWELPGSVPLPHLLNPTQVWGDFLQFSGPRRAQLLFLNCISFTL